MVLLARTSVLGIGQLTAGDYHIVCVGSHDVHEMKSCLLVRRVGSPLGPCHTYATHVPAWDWIGQLVVDDGCGHWVCRDDGPLGCSGVTVLTAPSDMAGCRIPCYPELAQNGPFVTNGKVAPMVVLTWPGIAEAEYGSR